MRDPARIGPFLERIAQEWEKYPDLRFGQLVANIAEHGGADLFMVEDTEWAEMIAAWDSYIESAETANAEWSKNATAPEKEILDKMRKVGFFP